MICPTSVLVESLFSESKWIFDDRRLATSPEHIEEFMFLKSNHSLWDLQFFSEKVYSIPAENDNDSEL